MESSLSMVLIIPVLIPIFVQMFKGFGMPKNFVIPSAMLLGIIFNLALVPFSIPQIFMGIMYGLQAMGVYDAATNTYDLTGMTDKDAAMPPIKGGSILPPKDIK